MLIPMAEIAFPTQMIQIRESETARSSHGLTKDHPDDRDELVGLPERSLRHGILRSQDPNRERRTEHGQQYHRKHVMKPLFRLVKRGLCRAQYVEQSGDPEYTPDVPGCKNLV